MILDVRDAWMKLKERRGSTYKNPSERARYLKAQHELLRKLHRIPLARQVGFKVDEAGAQLSLRKLIDGYLPTACAIIILTLLARRKKEGLEVKAGAVRGSRGDGWFLVLEISKTVRRSVAIPCPEIVVKAVELLERWSRPVRTEEQNGLFQVPGFGEGDGKPKEYLIGLHLNDFAQDVGVPALPNGTNFKFAAHQFRRLWVIIYIWRYDGDLGAASWFLCHFNIETTRLYANDAELGRMIHEESRHFTMQKVRAIAHGDAQSTGLLGRRLDKRLRRLMDDLRRRTRVVGDRELERECERLVDQLKLELRATPWGLCGCRPTEPARRRAKCLQGARKGAALALDGRPDPSGSTETVCAGCIHHMVDQLRQKHWQSELARTEALLARPGIPEILRGAYEERRTVLLSFISSFPVGWGTS